MQLKPYTIINKIVNQQARSNSYISARQIIINGNETSITDIYWLRRLRALMLTMRERKVPICQRVQCYAEANFGFISSWGNTYACMDISVHEYGCVRLTMHTQAVVSLPTYTCHCTYYNSYSPINLYSQLWLVLSRIPYI